MTVQLSLVVVLILIALGLTVASIGNKVPLWAAVFVICLILLIQLWR